MAGLSLKVHWRSFGPDKTYNIYYRRDDESEFTKANSIPLADSQPDNTYVISSNIAPETVYWVYVVETSDNKDIPETYIGPNVIRSTPILNKVKIITYSS
jgi:hypothetical protein